MVQFSGTVVSDSDFIFPLKSFRLTSHREIVVIAVIAVIGSSYGKRIRLCSHFLQRLLAFCSVYTVCTFVVLVVYYRLSAE